MTRTDTPRESTTSSLTSGNWFLRQNSRPDAEFTLFCLPYAGAGASAYRLWQTAFEDDIDLAAIQLPGRENRVHEEPVIDPAEVADVITASVAECPERPFAFYGHSLGARVAFEVTRCLRDAGGPMPTVMFVAAARAPHLDDDGPFDGLSTVVDDDALIERLVANGGLPESIVAVPDLLTVLLPTIKADLRYLDDYVYTPGAPLDVPIVAFAGDHDHAVPVRFVEPWADYTTADFELHVIDGGHFFLNERVAEMVRLISNELRLPTRSSVRSETA